jgi:hypothetical protein
MEMEQTGCSETSAIPHSPMKMEKTVFQNAGHSPLAYEDGTECSEMLAIPHSPMKMEQTERSETSAIPHSPMKMEKTVFQNVGHSPLAYLDGTVCSEMLASPLSPM